MRWITWLRGWADWRCCFRRLAALPRRTLGFAGANRCLRWRFKARSLEATAGSPSFLGSTHRHHQILGHVHLGVADGFTDFLLQGSLDGVVADLAAVLRDQRDQGVSEVVAVRHRVGFEQ